MIRLVPVAGAATQFNFQSNRLRRLPSTLGALTRLDRVFLNENLLQSLPVELTEISPSELRLDDNELCQVPRVVFDWLEMYAPGWDQQYSDDARETRCEVDVIEP